MKQIGSHDTNLAQKICPDLSPNLGAHEILVTVLDVTRIFQHDLE